MTYLHLSLNSSLNNILMSTKTTFFLIVLTVLAWSVFLFYLHRVTP